LSMEPGRNLGLEPKKPTKEFVQLPDTGKDNKQERINRHLSERLPFRVQQLMRLWISLGFRIGGIKTKQYQRDVKALVNVLSTVDYIPHQKRKLELQEIAKGMRTFKLWLDDPENLIFLDRSDDIIYKKGLKRCYLDSFIYNPIGRSMYTKSWLMTCISGVKPPMGYKGRRSNPKVKGDEELLKIASRINRVFNVYCLREMNKKMLLLNEDKLHKSAYYRAAVILTNFFNRHPGLKDTPTYQFKEQYMVQALFEMNNDKWEQFHPGWLGTWMMEETLEKFYEMNGGAL